MITPKPLSKKDLALIREGCTTETRLTDTEGLLDKLIAAEAYWREVVKETRPRQCSVYTPDGIHENILCLLCGAGASDEPGSKIDHKPDCPWLLAQEP